MTLLRRVARLLTLLALASLCWCGMLTAVSATPSPTVVDGMAFPHLPPGLGSATDFHYAYDGVHFVSRTWESARPEGGYRVDLDLVVMRGARLSDAHTLHDWLIAYQDRPAGEAHYVPVRVHGRPGWLARDQVFWLERPGLAVSVLLDGSRFSTLQVARTGWPAHEMTGG